MSSSTTNVALPKILYNTVWGKPRVFASGERPSPIAGTANPPHPIASAGAIPYPAPRRPPRGAATIAKQSDV